MEEWKIVSTVFVAKREKNSKYSLLNTTVLLEQLLCIILQIPTSVLP